MAVPVTLMLSILKENTSMTIYTFDKVTEFLTLHNAENVYFSYRAHHFKKHYPEVYETIIDTTNFLGETNFVEQLYFYTNGITERPTCKMCSNPIAYNTTTKALYVYCSRSCAGKDKEIQDKKKATSMANFGVSSYFKTPESRKKSSANTKKRKQEEMEKLIMSCDSEPCKLTRKEYKRLVLRITEWMYTKYKSTLDPDGLRSNAYHVDHMVSILFGFANNIPPSIIGDINNLQMLDAKQNIGKSSNNAITFDVLMERYNEFYADSENERPPLDADFISKHGITVKTIKKKTGNKPKHFKYTEVTGVCVHCGGDANYIKNNKTYVCKPSAKDCPVKKEEIRVKNRAKDKERADLRRALAPEGVTIKAAVVNSDSTRQKKSDAATGKRWFNNGVHTTFALECPPGYVEGRGKSWFNNGIISSLEYSCPAGYVPGRLLNSE